ncbi:hypothetical protein [Pseudochrobactrum asaccharolyticum]|uniref:Uncharacterized protein n=1 Tax=Pseudochrobactrum asaccharolyticum TaxID=354351 RepID=A0A366DXX3_9HYPH|nr:hypothetical protein [Pseudochrobactrum asaccharolyticum]RBO94961.1 hypothetical protein DFR47_104323 [Pseudochrobactrum asaccharolyticum]
MSDGIKLGKIALALLDRMIGKSLILIRQTSETAVAVKQGGYVYFSHPDCRAVRADVARQLIGLGILVSQKDDLFSEADGGGAKLCRL